MSQLWISSKSRLPTKTSPFTHTWRGRQQLEKRARKCELRWKLKSRDLTSLYYGLLDQNFLSPMHLSVSAAAASFANSSPLLFGFGLVLDFNVQTGASISHTNDRPHSNYGNTAREEFRRNGSIRLDLSVNRRAAAIMNKLHLCMGCNTRSVKYLNYRAVNTLRYT